LATYGEVEKSWEILAGTFGILLTVNTLYASAAARWPGGHLGVGFHVLEGKGQDLDAVRQLATSNRQFLIEFSQIPETRSRLLPPLLRFGNLAAAK